MARGVNKAILIGNLGNDPEVRYTPSGSAVASISLATSETWRDKQSGEVQDRTEWHRVVFFNRLAEIIGEYLHKGSKIYIEGSLRTRKWQDKNGVDRYTTEIIANEMHMLDSKSASAAPSEKHPPHQASQSHHHEYAEPAMPRNNSADAAVPFNDVAAPVHTNMDDDIPF